MSDQTPHPHDQFFKQSFGRKEVVLDLLESRLPQPLFQEIDPNSLRLTNKTFVGKGNFRRESDLIFQAAIADRSGYIYFLIEHQSKVDLHMPFRFLEYNVRLMRQHLSEEGHQKLPLILNFCVYNGRVAYHGPTSLWELFERPDLARAHFLAPFRLIDLHTESYERLLTEKRVAFAALALQAGSQRNFTDFVRQFAADFAKFLRKGYIPYAEELVLYFLHQSQDESWIEKLQSITLDNPEIKELIMSTAQRLIQKGIQEGEQLGILKGIQKGRQEGEQLGIQKGRQEGEQLGIQKGIQKGRQEESRQIAREMLKDRESVEKIMRYTGLSKEEIQQLAL